ncbi:MAG: preprotein translocase subunit SecG [Deltaproteobacteria bacterium]|nr:preprotein translocase subunit SecG [Deltaproteobacteria bacterium]
METLLLGIHYFLCFFLVVVILLQAGKGADIGAAFGGASQTVFGSRGPATFLAKMTAIAAILFLVTSLSLAELAKRGGSASVIDNAAIPEQTAPDTPQEGAPASDTTK